jgi:hypothetical protein
MGFTMNMHDATFNLNSLSFVFARCGNSNNINNLQIDGSGEENLKDANGDDTPSFEMHMEKLKKQGTT